ncbi:MAG: T9SS type A sorting domain-containing protein [Sphingobacteriales bacterium]|nr:MAG: T9SS type A sorting domain-containing protein [Sphingobacteriales bacterium]
MTRFLLSISFAALSLGAFAQAPSGYYTDTTGLTGYALKTRLHTIIKTGHSDQGYGQLYEGYKTTDKDRYYENDGTLLDLYSEKPNGVDAYTFSLTNTNDRCGNYSAEGDCYNREHTVPQSLFNSASPMKNDIHFVIPTDGKVNGQRGNIPYGKVNSPNWTSTNGTKRGPNVSGGYSGTVFEPIDEFKGDFARTVFYFATRYQDRIPNFTQGNILDGSSTRSLQQWQVNLFLEWHHQDPVSQREIDRNNAAYTYQGNRNPFVDHPAWVDCIWAGICPTVDTGIVDTGNHTAINKLALQNSIDLYPNPASSAFQLYLKDNNKLTGLSIVAVDGRPVYTESRNYNSLEPLTVNIQQLNAGMYFIHLYTEKGTIVKKLFKQ